MRASLNWEVTHPSLASEKVDWYSEYIARHAPLSLSWLPHPCDIRGIGLLKRDSKDILVTPLQDGSICLWDLGTDVDRPDLQAGQIKACSKWGTLFSPNQKKDAKNHISSDNAVECVSVDQFSQRAYFAAHSSLTEVDLSTLQATSRQPFPQQICSLSEGGTHPHPLTVGTTRSVHIYDPRDSSPRPFFPHSTSLVKGLSSIDPPQDEPFPDFQRLYSGDASRSKRTRFAPIDPLPLSTVHISHDIHIGGRFPSVLTYDRRFFPQKLTSIYSGARISALASFTFPNDVQQNLVAAGEYKGKGSLEVYPLSHDDTSFTSLPQPVKNRTTASRSKLLSVIRHGTRLLFSDSDGQLKWVERDGSTLVRCWNIHSWSIYSSSEARNSIFNAGADEGDVARKLLALDEGEKSEILVWTGERVGVMGYGSKTRFGKVGKKESDGSGDEGTASGDERKYGRMMRRALERQADEVRFVRGLGLGR